MKTGVSFFIVLFYFNLANAVTGQICGALNPSEGCLSEYDTAKPQGVCLVSPATTRTDDVVFLRARSHRQKDLLASLSLYEEYCIQGDLQWCGKNSAYKCLTVDSLR